MSQIDSPFIRDVVLEARKNLIAAGYKPQGTEQAWQQALRDRGDQEILHGVQLVIDNALFRDVLAAQLIQALKEDDWKRPAPGLEPDKGVWWKDDEGREHFHHPDIPGSVKPPERS